MKVEFTKYQGAGNDFVMIDNRSGSWNDLSIKQIQAFCDRRFGVGADGLIKINLVEDFDFEVDYYNADGSKSFCGNGARCAVKFAQELGITKSKVEFIAIDGKHSAQNLGELIDLEMNSVSEFEQLNSDYIIHTGSPHFIRFCNELGEQNMVEIGKQIRYSERFVQEGINVNLIESSGEHSFAIRTYERGVEDETLACGTGVTAAALAFSIENEHFGTLEYSVKAVGGDLKVRFNRTVMGVFENIHLIGPAVRVFNGEAHV